MGTRWACRQSATKMCRNRSSDMPSRNSGVKSTGKFPLKLRNCRVSVGLSSDDTRQINSSTWCDSNIVQLSSHLRCPRGAILRLGHRRQLEKTIDQRALSHDIGPEFDNLYL